MAVVIVGESIQTLVEQGLMKQCAQSLPGSLGSVREETSHRTQSRRVANAAPLKTVNYPTSLKIG